MAHIVLTNLIPTHCIFCSRTFPPWTEDALRTWQRKQTRTCACLTHYQLVSEQLLVRTATEDGGDIIEPVSRENIARRQIREQQNLAVAPH